MIPHAKVEHALNKFDDTLERALTLESSQRGVVLDEAASYISAARAEMYETQDGEDHYLQRQRAIEAARDRERISRA